MTEAKAGQKVSEVVALSRRVKDLLSGKLQTAIISPESYNLFFEAGQIAGFRVSKVAGPGQEYLKKNEVDLEKPDTEIAIVPPNRQVITIDENSTNGRVDPTRFWKILQALQEGRVITEQVETLRVPDYIAVGDSTDFEVKLIARPREGFLSRQVDGTVSERVIVKSGHLGIAIIKPRDTGLDFNSFWMALSALEPTPAEEKE